MTGLRWAYTAPLESCHHEGDPGRVHCAADPRWVLGSGVRGKRQGEASGRRAERLQVPLSPAPILAPSLPSFLNISGTNRTNITRSKNDFFFLNCSSLWVLLGCMQRNGVLSGDGHFYDPRAVCRGTGQVPGRLGQAFTQLPQAGGSPAHSRWTPPVHSALTPAQGSPERAGCRLATAAPGPWGSFLPGGTKRRSGHC